MAASKSIMSGDGKSKIESLILSRVSDANDYIGRCNDIINLRVADNDDHESNVTCSQESHQCDA